MSRYIDAECDCVTEVINRRAFNSREDVQDFLDNIPTADVVPVKHGRWISAKYKCSECGVLVWGNDFNYCPNCGAEMNGDDGDG